MRVFFLPLISCLTLSCNLLLNDFEFGTKLMQAGKKEEAYQKFIIACNDGDMNGCNAVGEIDYEKGNIARSKDLFTRACFDEIMSGCYNLGRLIYNSGNTGEGKLYYKKACQGGELRACQLLGLTAQGDKGEHLPQKANYMQMCNAGGMKECMMLGVLAEQAGDMAEATRLYRKSCRGGNLTACYHLSDLQVLKKDRNK